MPSPHAAPPPPPTPTEPHTDVLHGTVVPDPYRWLEDAEDPRVRAWVAAQNAVTAQWLAGVRARGPLRERLAAVWDHPRAGSPWRKGRRWFQLRNTGLQDQDVLYVGEQPDAVDRVLVDPNVLSADGTVALSAAAASADGELLAYATSRAGSDWLTWRVRRTADGVDLDDVLEWGKFSSAAWLPDGSGFCYSAYEAPPPGAVHAAANRDQQLRLHRLGDDQSADVVVHVRPDRPELGFAPEVTEDARYLVVTVWEGTEPNNGLAIAPLDGGQVGALRYVLDEFDATWTFVGSRGSRLWLLTTKDAPRGRIVALDADSGALEEIVPEGADTLEHAVLSGDRLLLLRLSHARHRLTAAPVGGGAETALDLPDAATFSGLTTRDDSAVGHVVVTSFAEPASVWRIDSDDVTCVVPPGLPAGDFITEQVFVPSGGAEVPMFLVRRSDVAPTGVVPTVLYGYGGFRISLTPQFRSEWRTWIDAGGMVAVANLRGGGEYGQPWHDAGRRERKQQVFDDVAACARWLAGSGWTAPAHIGITGRSNGGLLVGAAITQHPELYGAAVAEVGVLDMLRFHTWTIGWAWASDYGTAQDPDEFRTLLAYSPYHNVRPGTAYPPTLITTGDHDDRVHPAHSYKFAAALQAGQCGADPILLRVDTDAGHGAGKPTAKHIDERADVLAFLAATLGLAI